MSKWKCGVCSEYDYGTREAYYAHLRNHMIPVNEDTIEQEVDERLKPHIEFVQRNGIWREETVNG